MNKFLIFPCIKQEDGKGYNGPVVTLACASNISFALFFPVSEENAALINFVLEEKKDKKPDINTNILGVYKTMMDSWRAGERFLSGILMDVVFDTATEEEVITVKLLLSDEDGNIDSVTKVNFTHAVLIAAMERKEIIVSDDLLDKLMPKDEREECEDCDGCGECEEDSDVADTKKPNKEENKKYPIDKDILDIAKQIMQGKIK